MGPSSKKILKTCCFCDLGLNKNIAKVIVLIPPKFRKGTVPLLWGCYTLLGMTHFAMRSENHLMNPKRILKYLVVSSDMDGFVCNKCRCALIQGQF